mmetsp:Transcript_17694/g.24965  ORF Transcript_17694/g.24965 Transcript_17694/m.24965 type:complete len:683 (+) Transcript_17694:418-2466(+)|eukprot:CAMPEP_0184868502 /NCGR_PEP_ID=MMETSP0580-20130426/30673_1 /TAXON_ID=1118495 /ORGANISM="Dactyliosolen fragilissimus" /LENGTH=682 /DNA_ID=CAMNT_0027369441 /DNA_START=365 /DNA_END=2413 /DNA_ORIENTATION=-
MVQKYKTTVALKSPSNLSKQSHDQRQSIIKSRSLDYHAESPNLRQNGFHDASKAKKSSKLSPVETAPTRSSSNSVSSAFSNGSSIDHNSTFSNDNKSDFISGAFDKLADFADGVFNSSKKNSPTASNSSDRGLKKSYSLSHSYSLSKPLSLHGSASLPRKSGSSRPNPISTAGSSSPKPAATTPVFSNTYQPSAQGLKENGDVSAIARMRTKDADEDDDTENKPPKTKQIDPAEFQRERHKKWRMLARQAKELDEAKSKQNNKGWGHSDSDADCTGMVFGQSVRDFWIDPSSLVSKLFNGAQCGALGDADSSVGDLDSQYTQDSETSSILDTESVEIDVEEETQPNRRGRSRGRTGPISHGAEDSVYTNSDPMYRDMVRRSISRSRSRAESFGKNKDEIKSESDDESNEENSHNNSGEAVPPRINVNRKSQNSVDAFDPGDTKRLMTSNDNSSNLLVNELNNMSLSQTPERKHNGSTNFVEIFLKDITTQGIYLMWHSDQNSKKYKSKPSSVVASIQISESNVSRFTEPILSWQTPEPTPGRYSSSRPSEKSPLLQKHQVCLFDISSVSSLNSAIIDLKGYPFAVAEKSIYVTLNDGTSVFFEAVDEAEARRFVHGLRWIIARLSFNLIRGNKDVCNELLVVKNADKNGKDALSSNGKISDKVMMDVLNQLVEKAVMKVEVI